MGGAAPYQPWVGPDIRQMDHGCSTASGVFARIPHVFVGVPVSAGHHSEFDPEKIHLGMRLHVDDVRRLTARGAVLKVVRRQRFSLQQLDTFLQRCNAIGKVPQLSPDRNPVQEFQYV